MARKAPSLVIICILTSALANNAVPQEAPVSRGESASGRSAEAPGLRGQAGPTPPRPGAGPSAAAGSQGQALLAAAVQALEGRQSISAKLRHDANLLGKYLVGSGIYLEQRRGEERLSRFELRTQLGDQSSSLKQVCDGRYLWTYRKLPSETKITRIDVVRVSQAMRRAGKTEEQVGASVLPSLGGFPKLLRGLHASFDFDYVEQGRWGERQQLFWRVQGHWQRDQLVRLLPAQKAAIERGDSPDLSKLPEYAPDQVVVLLGQEDLFPYRIEYRRRLAEHFNGTADSRSLVSIDLFEVNFNVPIDAGQFIFHPGESDFTDQTDSYIQSLLGKP